MFLKLVLKRHNHIFRQVHVGRVVRKGKGISMRVLYNANLRETRHETQLYFCSHYQQNNCTFKRLMHMHEDFVEVILVHKGKGKYQIDGIPYDVKAGDLIVVNSFVAHDEYLFEHDQLETYCLGIKGLRKATLRENALISDESSPVISLKDYKDFFYHSYGLLFNMMEQKLFDEAQSLMGSILGILNEKILTENSKINEYDEEMILLRVKEFIELNFFEPITLDSLAKMVNISPYYLSHLYKEKFDCSPVKYLIKRRIGEAQTLLQNSSQSITDISFSVGFNNPCHFHSTFKKMVGITPKQYRTEYDNANEIYDEKLKIKSFV